MKVFKNQALYKHIKVSPLYRFFIIRFTSFFILFPHMIFGMVL